MRTAAALLCMLVAIPAIGEESFCATSAEHIEWLRGVGRWSAARAHEIARKGVTGATAAIRGDIYVVPSDETNTPFRRPFDLSGRTLIFERQGSTGFAVQNVPIEWAPDRGTRVVLDRESARVTLDFDFPFYDRVTGSVWVTSYNAIYIDPPLSNDPRQFGDMDLAIERQAIIAPLLTTRRSRLTSRPEIYLRKESDSAVFTWIVDDLYAVSATLHQSGEIDFSYQNVTDRPAAAAVLITSGREPWRSRRSTIASRSDDAGDAANGVPMLDVTNVAVTRVNDLDLFEVRIRTGSPFDREQLSSETVQFEAHLGDQAIRYIATAEEEHYVLPVWGSTTSSPGARVAGSELVLSFLREHVASSSAQLTVSVYRNGLRIDTTEALAVSLPASSKRVRTDFSAVTQTVIDDGPVAESFTTPILSVYRIWEQLKEADPTLTDEAIDGVAIYQNFFTDLVTYAGAYSTGGNAGVTGLFEGDQWVSHEPRTPALMHMNKIRYGHNSAPERASRVVLHELGHRWLMFISLLENGIRSRKLNPVSAHPAQYVDTRAAFNVFTGTDTSVMGGGYFTDHGGGIFSTSSYGPFGYSWLDLYLMGLATPAEVPAMFYVDDSDPELGGEYYAPEHQTFRGTKRDFTLQQVIDATGKRQPAYPWTQQLFRVVFVLVTDPDRALSDDDLAEIESYRGLLTRDFTTATGGRGRVLTSLAPAPPGPRRRAVAK